MKRNASAQWEGSLKDGKGTNPEELLGAAHAGCFSMSPEIRYHHGYSPGKLARLASSRGAQ